MNAAVVLSRRVRIDWPRLEDKPCEQYPSAKTTSEPTAAIGSPIAWPVCASPTPIAKTIVLAIQIQT